MSILTMNDDKEYLHDADFPNYYVDKIHPEDYIINTRPILEKIYHTKRGHNRLLLRILIKMDRSTYLPLTFVCDTGACTSLYLCPKALIAIKSRIMKDELDNEYIELKSEKRMAVEETSYIHENVNIIGLKALFYFGLVLSIVDGEYIFEFNNLPDYF